MREIVFYDFDFNRLGDFPRFISLNINKKYCGVGTAELHFSLAETKVIKLLEENPYVFFYAGENAVIVTGWQLGEDIAIFGRTPEWLLTKRGVEALGEITAKAEVVARTAVNRAAGDFVVLGDILDVGAEVVYSTDKVRVLADVVCEVLKPWGLGFRLVPDINLKKFVFSVYLGEESLCMISPSSRTAYDMTYTVEKQDKATNSGWYEQKYTDMGSWDAYNNSPSLADGSVENAYKFYEISSETYYQSGSKYYPVERFGLSCPKGYYIYCDSEKGTWKVTNERPDTVWVYIDGSEESGAKKWDAVLLGHKTKEEALAEIAELKTRDKADAETKSIRFGEDYKLGDIVRVQAEFGEFRKAYKKRVTEVNIYYDIEKSGIIPILENLEG